MNQSNDENLILRSKIVNKTTSAFKEVTLRRGQKVNDFLNGLVCLVVGEFKFAVRSVAGIGPVMEATVGQRTAELLVEEQEQERDLHTFGGEPVSVAGSITFEQAVTFEFAQIVAELVQPVSMGRKLERGEDGLMDLLGGPTADRVAAMQESFQ